MADQIAPRYGWLPCLADYAHATPKNAGPCKACGRAMLRGDRIARLTDGTGWVHVAGCVTHSHPCKL
jgi:hypothetical protein